MFQRIDLFFGQENTSDHFPDDPCGEPACKGRHRYDRASLSDDAADRLNQFLVAEHLGPDRIQDDVFFFESLFDRQPGQIIHIDGDEAVLPPAEYPENRESPQEYLEDRGEKRLQRKPEQEIPDPFGLQERFISVSTEQGFEGSEQGQE